ncbi:Maf family protein [Demequina flava]|uniref:Maf family protein n=1 Tax=Demequina flava TaxID=1095025 RepID=UPI0007860F10|nr:Maf family protein [Demequina flava]
MTTPVPLLLASQSPARLATLRSAGVEPEVIVSGVDEDAILERLSSEYPEAGPADAVLALAQAKAEHVAREYETGSIVLGCDSMLELDGEIYGKPGTPEIARERWQRMRGRSGVLHTGHWLVDDREDGTRGSVGASSDTVVHFANLTDDEIDAYIATGEPLKVAGAFTVDGLGGPYVEGIEGDFHGVVGVSLPLLRALLAELSVPFHTLRASPQIVETAQPTSA